MAITTGDLQDLLQLSQDTLYFVGADFRLDHRSVRSVGDGNHAWAIIAAAFGTPSTGGIPVPFWAI